MKKQNQKIIYSINKKNINPKEFTEVIQTKVFFLLIIFLLPLTIVFTSANIVLRIPDIFGYEIKSNNISEEFDNMVDEDALAKKFGDFFIHKTNSFSLVLDYNDYFDNVFKPHDILLLKNIRSKLDITLGLAIFFFVLLIISFCYLFKKQNWSSIKIATISGLSIGFLILIFSNIIAINKALANNFLMFFANGKFSDESIIPIFFNHSFGIAFALIISLISIIISIAFFSFILYLGNLLKLRGKNF